MAEFCSLQGRTALVTGGSRGIGAAISAELARAGAAVVVGYNTGRDEASALAAEIGGRAVTRPMMKKRAGVIVNLSSIVGLRGNLGQTNYGAAKAGIIGFTKALARELGSRNVRANVVAPGYVKTRLTDVIPEEGKALMLANTPLGRLGDPEDVAAAVRFLCADEASFITGDVLLVDGGLGM